MSKGYLFDTHALIFWTNKQSVSPEFITFFDEQNQQGSLYVSSISFWEIAFLVQKGRLALADIQGWSQQLLEHTSLQLLQPTVAEMISSVSLPSIHKDPFDRLLIAQAQHNNLTLVTQDSDVQKYGVSWFWL